MSQSRKKIKLNSNKIIESDVSGVVKLYDDTGEYGIITEDNTRRDVSFLKSAVSKDSLRRDDPIRVGDEVIFDLFLAPEGYSAESVQIFSQDVEGSDSDDTDNLCLTGIGLRNKRTYQEENNRPHVALPNSTDLVKQRERGKIFYKSATENTSATVRIRLENSITCYKSTFACSIKKDDEASALKKIGMASWKLATIIALESEKEESEKSILKHFKEALKFFYMAYALRSYKSVSWGAKLVESWENCLEETCEWLALLDTTKRVAGFSELLDYAPDCSLKANGYIEYSTLLFHEGLIALQDGEYKECHRFMRKCYLPIREAERLCEGDCSIKSEIAVLQVDVYIHTCVAKSSMARERGDGLLEEHLKNKETVNTMTDTIRTVIGLYEKAAELCRDQDLEQEAIAYSRLGRVYGKVLTLRSRGKGYYKKAIQLALSMNSRTFYNVAWFKESTEFVEDFQKHLNKDEEEDKDKEAALKEMEEDVEKLSKMATNKGDLDFVKDIYKTWPPKAPGAKLNEKLSKKKLLLKAISHYHPDKVDKEVHGKKWFYFSQEITKHLTFKYSKRHSQVH